MEDWNSKLIYNVKSILKFVKNNIKSTEFIVYEYT